MAAAALSSYEDYNLKMSLTLLLYYASPRKPLDTTSLSFLWAYSITGNRKLKGV